MTTTEVAHVLLDENGVAWIDKTRVKVIEVVLDKIAYRWDADEIDRQHPNLRLAQIHAAFTYYYDHQDKLDEQIKASLEKAENASADAPETPGRAKLRHLELRP